MSPSDPKCSPSAIEDDAVLRDWTHRTEHYRIDDPLGDGHGKGIRINWLVRLFLESMIVCSTVQMGICVHHDFSKLDTPCEVSEHFFVAVFLLEFVIKVHALRWAYFKDCWNRLDFSLMVLAVLDSWLVTPILGARVPSSTLLDVLRLLRILRILKLLRVKRELRVLLEGLVASLKSIVWVAIMLGLIIYASAILCVSCFREVETSSRLTFGTVPEAMFTMFSISIVADWTDIVMPVVSQYWWSSFFFVGFTILATFGVLNLIIGVIMERTAVVQEAYASRERFRQESQRMRLIEEVADIAFSGNGGTVMGQDEMQAVLMHPEHGATIQHLMKDVDLPAGYSVADLHAMLDRDASGSITRDEFVNGMGRLIFCNDFQRSCLVQGAIADVKVQMREMMDTFAGHLELELSKLREELRTQTYLAPPHTAAAPEPSDEHCSKDGAQASSKPRAGTPLREVHVHIDDPECPISPIGASSLRWRGSAAKDSHVRSRLIEQLQAPLVQFLQDAVSIATTSVTDGRAVGAVGRRPSQRRGGSGLGPSMRSVSTSRSRSISLDEAEALVRAVHALWTGSGQHDPESVCDCSLDPFDSGVIEPAVNRTSTPIAEQDLGKS